MTPPDTGEEHDEYLAEHIRSALAREGAHQLGITVSVHGTEVRVAGAVDTPECRAEVIEHVARLAPGREVMDDLDYHPEVPPEPPERIA
jgi:osmotically-inducible protein OsmY